MQNGLGRTVEFVDSGEGTPLLFVPGSFSTPAAWRGIQKHLTGPFRFLTTSLCGYGKTSEFRNLSDYLIHHEVEILKKITENLDSPIHLIGHSFGGTVCLATALENTLDIASIITFEANPINLIKEGNKTELFFEAKSISDRFEKEYYMGNQNAAKLIIDFWGGERSFDQLPTEVQQYCRETTFANILDWRTAFSFQPTIKDYKELKIPTLFVRGELANKAMVEITDKLSACITGSSSAIVANSTHFLINTHPKTCARLINNFLAKIL